MYSASTVDSATQASFLQFQDTRELAKRWHVSLVLFLSSLHPAKLESEKSIRFKEVPFWISQTNIGCALKVFNDPFNGY